MDRRAIATALVSGEPRWYTWDLTAHVRALKLAGATQVDLGLDNDEYNDALASFSSRESPSNAPFFALSTESTNAAPTVAVPASASPTVVDRNFTVLRAVGADDQGELNLSYTWQTIGTPPAPVTYNDANGTNYAGYYALAYFTAPGNYDFRVTIADTQGLSVTSDVSVTVQLSTRYWRTVVEPRAVTLHPGETVQLYATVFDQFGATATPQPTVYWQGHFASSGGSVTESGLYTAGAEPGDYRVYARTVGLFAGASSITIVP
jgi:hypothetical protein